MRSNNYHGPFKVPQRRLTRRKLLVISICCIILCVTGCALYVIADSKFSSTLQNTSPSQYNPVTVKNSDRLPADRVYMIEQRPEGYLLTYSDVTGATVPVVLLPDRFGTESTDTVGAVEVSPNHRYIAIDGRRDHGDVVWLVSSSDNQVRAVPSDANGAFLHWLPDGLHFLFRPNLPVGNYDKTWNPGLWIVEATGGTHIDIPLPDGANAMSLIDAAPSPDGKQLVLSLTSGLGEGSTTWLMAPDGSQAQCVTQSETIVGLFAWSPDNTQIAYMDLPDSVVPYRSGDLKVMYANGSDQHTIASADGGHGFSPAWSPDGSKIAYVARRNDGDGRANTLAGALVSGIEVAEPKTGSHTTIADEEQTGQPRNSDPVWRADGTLLFSSMPASDGFGAALSRSTSWMASDIGVGTQNKALLQPMNGLNAMSMMAVVP
jgi:WD40 repeat protein